MSSDQGRSQGETAFRRVKASFQFLKWGSLSLVAVALIGFGSLDRMATSAPVPNSGFSEVTTFRSIGTPTNTVLGPGPTPGSERYYAAYAHSGSAAELVAVDPNTGASQTFESPNKKVAFYRGMVTGPDGKIYLGTVGEARLFRFDPKTGRTTDLGRSSATETYLWDLTVGSDGWIYGATFPNAKLIRFDPQTGQMEDLGRMDPEQQYARFIAADKGFVYLTVGFAKNRLVAYQISTGEHRNLLPKKLEQYQLSLVTSQKGDVYVGVRRPAGGLVVGYRADGWNLVPVDLRNSQLPVPRRLPQLRDGRLISRLTDREIESIDPQSRKLTIKQFRPATQEMPIFRLGAGGTTSLYGSSNLPLRLFRVDLPSRQLQPLAGEGGAIYSFLFYQSRIFLGGYSTLAPIQVMDDENRAAMANATAPTSRPITWKDADKSWRPWAMIVGPDKKIYIGSVNGYGNTGGKLTVVDPSDSQVDGSYTVIADQSVGSLATWNSLVVGGTSVRGGDGSAPISGEAHLFFWDPVRQASIFDIVPVPGAKDITGLVARNGQIFGLAGAFDRRNQLFVFDPQTRKVVHRSTLPAGIAVNATLWNSLAVGPDGDLYGLCTTGIYSIDPKTYEVRMKARYSGTITAGFALIGDQIYFASGSRIVKYDLAS